MEDLILTTIQTKLRNGLVVSKAAPLTRIDFIGRNVYIFESGQDVKKIPFDDIEIINIF